MGRFLICFSQIPVDHFNLRTIYRVSPLYLTLKTPNLKLISVSAPALQTAFNTTNTITGCLVNQYLEQDQPNFLLVRPCVCTAWNPSEDLLNFFKKRSSTFRQVIPFRSVVNFPVVKLAVSFLAKPSIRSASHCNKVKMNTTIFEPF